MAEANVAEQPDVGEAPVLVTGASGYIATHVVQQLQQQGYMVRGTVRSLQNATKVEPLRGLCPGAKYPIELVEADLMKADSWPAAVKDCQYVLHVASPFPMQTPRHEDEVIKPAVDGTLNVLRACHDAGTIKRVVLTSSVAAITQFSVTYSETRTEDDWCDLEKEKMPYAKSKTLAEKAAWDYLKELPETERFELAVINPGYVIGPVLCGSSGTSMELFRRLLQHEMPMVPRTNFSTVDVRDVAAAHLAAMKVPEAAGNRHIICTENMWFVDIAKTLDKEFKSQGYKVPTRLAPYSLLWLYGRFDKSVKMLLPVIGKVVEMDNSRMLSVLGIQPRDVRQAAIEMAYSMIEQGFVKKTSKYTGPKDQEQL